jgi:hypothetical protein
MAQSPSSGLQSGLTADALRRYLLSRRVGVLNESQLQTWRERLKNASEAADDLWWIGGQRACRLEQASQQVIIDGTLTPLNGCISVEVRRPDGSGAKRIELTLPAEHMAIRILRDPFERAVAVRQSHKDRALPGSALRFSHQKILVSLGEGSVVAYPIPNAPGGEPGRPRRFQAPGGNHAIALEFIPKHGAIALSARDNEMPRRCGSNSRCRRTAQARCGRATTTMAMPVSTYWMWLAT